VFPFGCIPLRRGLSTNTNARRCPTSPVFKKCHVVRHLDRILTFLIQFVDHVVHFGACLIKLPFISNITIYHTNRDMAVNKITTASRQSSTCSGIGSGPSRTFQHTAPTTAVRWRYGWAACDADNLIDAAHGQYYFSTMPSVSYIAQQCQHD
jgi:hypothetical protein